MKRRVKVAPRRVKVAFRPARARYRTKAAVSVIKPLLALAVVAGALVWGVGTVRDVMTRSQWLRVSTVEIAPLALQDGTPPEGFDRAMGVKPGDSQFSFSARRLRKRLRAQFPELATVRVRRGLDGTVTILYARRVAVAKVWDKGQWLGMDMDGGVFPMRVFTPEDAPPENALPGESARPLPILSGVPSGDAARPYLEFVGLLQRLPQSWTRGFYKMKIAPSGRGTLYFKDGPTVVWGTPAPSEDVVRVKADRLARVLRDPRLVDGVETARFVDDRRIAVKPKSVQQPV
jgi:hypothetical protein